MKLDIVALAQAERLDHGRGKAHRKAVAPSSDLHRQSPWIYRRTMYIQGASLTIAIANGEHQMTSLA